GAAVDDGGNDGGRQAFRGLVEQQQLGAERECARDRYHFTLASGEYLSASLAVALQPGEDPVGFRQPLSGTALARPRPCRNRNVLGYRQSAEDFAFLGGEAHA